MPLFYDNREDVDIFNNNTSQLLRTIRRNHNIWRYLRQDYLGGFFPAFERLFYLKYDYLSIGYDSAEEFAYRLAGVLEAVEPQYLGRLLSVDLVKNPMVSEIQHLDEFTIDSRRNKYFSKNNSISDAEAENINSAKGVGTTTGRALEYNNNQRASDKHALELGFSGGSETSNSAGINTKIDAKIAASDNKTEEDNNVETISDKSQTHHRLDRDSDSPQDGNVIGSLMPIGFTGIAGATGTKSKHDHYPKAEALVPLPWNSGYVSTTSLVNEANDEHTTEGVASIKQTLSQKRDSSFDTTSGTTGNKTFGTNQKNSESTSLSQEHDGEEGSSDAAHHAYSITRDTGQANSREQSRGYSDSESVAGSMGDNQRTKSSVGLSGYTVGRVWADWQLAQYHKNVLRDLTLEARKCFSLIL